MSTEKTKDFHVVWEIDVSAKTPREAALQALEAQEPGTGALVFDVFDDKGDCTRVDLWAETEEVLQTKLQEFLVILLYPDYLTDDFGQETYRTKIRATTPEEAITGARALAISANTEKDEDPYIDPEDFFVIACINDGLEIVA